MSNISFRQAVDFMRKTAGAPVGSVAAKGAPVEPKQYNKKPSLIDRVKKYTSFYDPYKGVTPKSGGAAEDLIKRKGKPSNKRISSQNSSTPKANDWRRMLNSGN